MIAGPFTVHHACSCAARDPERLQRSRSLEGGGNKEYVAWPCNNNNIAFGDPHGLCRCDGVKVMMSALTTIFYIKNCCPLRLRAQCRREAVESVHLLRVGLS